MGATLLEGRLYFMALEKCCVNPADCPWSWAGRRREVSAHAGLEGQVGALDMLGMSRCSLDSMQTHRILSQASLADEREIVCSDLEWIE